MKKSNWMTITREIREAVLLVLHEEYDTRGDIGNRTLEKLFAQALTTGPVREAISDAIDALRC